MSTGTRMPTDTASTGANTRTHSGKPITIGMLIVMAVAVAIAAYWLWIHKTPAIPGMAYFPGGVFLSGPDKKEMNLGAFYIDETEVSNSEFAEYCRASKACDPPTAGADLPVVNITVVQARAYAKWRGKRLPTALEWERAVRSADGVKYPWGDADDAGLANVRNNPILLKHELMPVRSYRPLPVYQMAGNAWEMVDGITSPDEGTVELFAQYLTPAPTHAEPWIQIRGGSFNSTLAEATGYSYKVIPERYAAPDIGFRCARSREQ